MEQNTNPDAVRFDDVYSPVNDESDDRAVARFVLIQAKHEFPDTFKTLLD